VLGRLQEEVAEGGVMSAQRVEETELDDPHEHWVTVEDFPGYSVSDKGRVRNDSTGRILALTENQYGVVKVGMSKDGKQHARSVALLVAKHHLEKPPDETVFDTPINLDGDRHNNRVENLMCHKQFEEGQRKGFKVPIQVLSTGEIFPNSMAAAMRYGILAEDTVRSVILHRHCFPTFQKFKVYEPKKKEESNDTR
jgi:hypothetical protein